MHQTDLCQGAPHWLNEKQKNLDRFQIHRWLTDDWLRGINEPLAVVSAFHYIFRNRFRCHQRCINSQKIVAGCPCRIVSSTLQIQIYTPKLTKTRLWPCPHTPEDASNTCVHSCPCHWLHRFSLTQESVWNKVTRHVSGTIEEGVRYNRAE